MARIKGLDEYLSPEEAAAALIHMAKHRGFLSNIKSDRGKNAPDESKKMLSAITTLEEKSHKYRSYS
jgi:Uncharacterized protein conserved in bacteria